MGRRTKERLIERKEKLLERLLKKNLYFRLIYEAARELKEFSINQLARELNISWNTAKKYIEQLEKYGIVKKDRLENRGFDIVQIYKFVS